jgi:hypothetical protein
MPVSGGLVAACRSSTASRDRGSLAWVPPAAEPASPLNAAEARIAGLVARNFLGLQRLPYSHVIAQAFPLVAEEVELLAHHFRDSLERLVGVRCALPLEVDLAL